MPEKSDGSTDVASRRSMVIGVALYNGDVVPRFCYGCFYSKLKVEGVVAIEAILDQPNVKETYQAFMDAFGEAASDMGLEAAVAAGADAESLKKISEYKQNARNKKSSSGGQNQRNRPPSR